MNKFQLARNIQRACGIELKTWRKKRNNALYRLTEDFVQWLLVDTSHHNVTTVVHYSIQALAPQFPHANLTLGYRVSDENQVDMWIKPEDWTTKSDEIVNQIVQQIAPSAVKPLTPEAIIEYIRWLESPHENSFVALGIACVMLGNINEGYHYFETAITKYKKIPHEWARVEEERIKKWVSYSSYEIVDILRQQAQEGIKELRLT